MSHKDERKIENNSSTPLQNAEDDVVLENSVNFTVSFANDDPFPANDTCDKYAKQKIALQSLSSMIETHSHSLFFLSDNWSIKSEEMLINEAKKIAKSKSTRTLFFYTNDKAC